MFSTKSKLKGEQGLSYDEISSTIVINESYGGIYPLVDVNNIDIGSAAKVGSDIQAWEKITIGEGVFVNGNVHCEGEIELFESKRTTDPTIVLGDLLATTKLSLKSVNGSQGVIIIHGNVYCETAEITANNVIIRGDLYVKKNISSKPVNGLFVGGRIRIGLNDNELGKGLIQNTGAYGMICYGDLSIGHNNSLLEPIIVLKHGVLKITDRDSANNPFKIRILTDTCLNCSLVPNKLFCNQYFNKTCEKFDFIDSEDIFEFVNNQQSNYKVVSWYWRSGLPQLKHNFNIYLLYKYALQRPKNIRFTDKIVDDVKIESLFTTYSNLLGNLAGASSKDFFDFLKEKIVEFPEYKNDRDIQLVMNLFQASLPSEKSEHEEFILPKAKMVEYVPFAHVRDLKEFKSAIEMLPDQQEVETNTLQCNNCKKVFFWRKSQPFLCPKCGSTDLEASADVGVYEKLNASFIKYSTNQFGLISEIMQGAGTKEIVPVTDFLKAKGCIIDKNNKYYYFSEYIRNKIYHEITEQIGYYSVRYFSEKYFLHEISVRQVFKDLNFDFNLFLTNNSDFLIHYDNEFLNSIGSKFSTKEVLYFEDVQEKGSVNLSAGASKDFLSFVLEKLEISNYITTATGILSYEQLSHDVIELIRTNKYHLISDVLRELEIDIKTTNIQLLYNIISHCSVDGKPLYFIEPQNEDFLFFNFIEAQTKFIEYFSSRTRADFKQIEENTGIPEKVAINFINKLFDLHAIEGFIDEGTNSFEKKSINVDLSSLQNITIDINYEKLVEPLKITLLKETEVGGKKYATGEENKIDLKKMYKDIKMKKIEFQNLKLEIRENPRILYDLLTTNLSWLENISSEEPVEKEGNTIVGYIILVGYSDKESPILTELYFMKKKDLPTTSLTLSLYSNDDELRSMLIEQIKSTLMNLSEFKVVDSVVLMSVCKYCGGSLNIDDIMNKSQSYVKCSICKTPNYISAWYSEE